MKTGRRLEIEICIAWLHLHQLEFPSWSAQDGRDKTVWAEHMALLVLLHESLSSNVFQASDTDPFSRAVLLDCVSVLFCYQFSSMVQPVFKSEGTEEIHEQNKGLDASWTWIW